MASEPSAFTIMFPPTKWDVAEDRLTPEAIEAKYDKISEEVDELNDALCDEGPERVLEEALDAMIASSGLVHRMCEIVGTTPDQALAKVHAKNHARDYYPSEPQPVRLCACGDDCGNY